MSSSDIPIPGATPVAEPNRSGDNGADEDLIAGLEQRMKSGSLTPREVLVSWANDQAAWVRQLVTDVLATGRPLSDEEVAHIHQLFLLEKRLADGDPPDVPEIGEQDDVVAEDHTLVLHQLSNVTGVNALSQNMPIEFDAQLTVLFGQNGSGKTGYARVIKRAAAVRTAEDILPNIAGDGSETAPSASFEVEVDGKAETVEWQNELGISPLTRISVFDAPAVTLHVDDELNYVYMPTELALFSHVNDGIQSVQARIAAEVSTLGKGSSAFIGNFTRGTEAFTLIETLGPTTDLAKLRELADLPDGANETVDKLRTTVSALTGRTLDELYDAARRRVVDLEQLTSQLQTVAGFNPEAYSVSLDAWKTAERERERVRNELFKSEELAGAPDEQWQEFITAADSYRYHLDLDDYPRDHDHCLYCRQPLSPVAVNLVRRYREFLDESTQRQHTEARQRLSDRVVELDDAKTQDVQRFLTDLKDDDDTPPWVPDAERLLKDAAQVASETAAAKPVSIEDVATRAKALNDLMTPHLREAVKHEKELRAQRADRETALARKRKELSELEDRVELNKRLAAIEVFVQNAKRGLQLEQLSSDISKRVRRSLTEASKIASEDLVNRNFEQFFAEECEALSAQKVGLSFQGRGGQVERRKSVARYRPSEILSEGEQKVLAVADFLAECRMRGVAAPIVFDDPVTSLDYRRLDELSERIGKLAEQHQVVVFTHNIMFASTLIALRQSKKKRVKFYEVRENGAEKGILAPDVEPRLDSPKDIAKRVEIAIAAAKKAEPVVQDALIENTYDLIRAWCEAFVEQELLSNVTQRYRKNIMMTKLRSIKLDRLDQAIDVIDPLFDKACRCMGGHSKAFEQSNVRPTIDEVEADWKKLKAARTTYMAE